jgi:hypothetical protein
VDIAKPHDRNTQNSEDFAIEVKDSWRERVQQNVEQWSSTALDAIFGFTTKPNVNDPNGNSLKYVCLFVNKTDLLPGMEDEIRRAYQVLTEAFRARCSGLRFELLLGSADKGTATPDLIKSLKEYSWPRDLAAIDEDE